MCLNKEPDFAGVTIAWFVCVGAVVDSKFNWKNLKKIGGDLVKFLNYE